MRIDDFKFIQDQFLQTVYDKKFQNLNSPEDFKMYFEELLRLQDFRIKDIKKGDTFLYHYYNNKIQKSREILTKNKQDCLFLEDCKFKENKVFPVINKEDINRRADELILSEFPLEIRDKKIRKFALENEDSLLIIYTKNGVPIQASVGNIYYFIRNTINIKKSKDDNNDIYQIKNLLMNTKINIKIDQINNLIVICDKEEQEDTKENDNINLISISPDSKLEEVPINIENKDIQIAIDNYYKEKSLIIKKERYNGLKGFIRKIKDKFTREKLLPEGKDKNNSINIKSEEEKKLFFSSLKIRNEEIYQEGKKVLNDKSLKIEDDIDKV